VKTCRYFLQAAGCCRGYQTHTPADSWRSSPSLWQTWQVSQSAKRAALFKFFFPLQPNVNVQLFFLLPKILDKKRREKRTNRFPIENQWGSFFTSSHLE
jgi:hypothetical protein